MPSFLSPLLVGAIGLTAGLTLPAPFAPILSTILRFAGGLR